jgi:hypothetical protein
MLHAASLDRTRLAVAVTLLVAFVATPAARADDESEREDAMFGDSEAREEEMFGDSEVGEEESREDDMFGDDSTAGPPSAATFGGDLLSDLDDALEVGGDLFSRAQVAWAEDRSLAEATLTAPSFLGAYLDVRPSERVRGFGRVRLDYDFTVEPGSTDVFGQPREPLQLLLDQAWVKFDLGQIVYVTAGRQSIRWGTGRFWNPSDFVNQRTRDSLDFFDTRTGIDLLKVHVPFEEFGWNLYVLGVFGGVDVIKETGLAARAEILLGEMELSFSTLLRNDAPLKLGADVSLGLWVFDLKAEATLQRGLDVPRYEGEVDLPAGTLPEAVDSDYEWYARIVTGGDVQIKYSDQDTIILGGEYFYNHAGYDGAELYPFLALSGAFTPFYLGRHYAAAYAALPQPLSLNDMTFTASTLMNLSDLSVLSRLDYSLELLTYLTFNAFVAVHYGQPGELKLGIEIPPIPQVPQLAQGLDIPTQFLDAGVALRIAF